MKLAVDPEKFDPNCCMREFKKLNKKYNILNDDLVSLPNLTTKLFQFTSCFDINI